jgi:hypothetical protein
MMEIRAYKGKYIKEKIQSIRNNIIEKFYEDTLKVIYGIDEETISASDTEAIEELIKDNEYYTYSFDDYCFEIEKIVFCE